MSEITPDTMFDDEVEALVQKHLPVKAFDAFKARIQSVEKLETEAKNRDTLVSDLMAEKVDLQKKVVKLQAKAIRSLDLDNRKCSLDNREEILKTAELRLKIDTLELKLEVECEKTAFCKEVALGLVRNTEYRENVYLKHSKPGEDQYSNPATIEEIKDSTIEKSSH